MKRIGLIVIFSFFYLPSVVFAATLLKPVPSLPSYSSPNELYLPAFLKALESANKSNKNLPIIEAEIKKEAATTTDLVSLFLKQASQGHGFKRQADSGSFLDQAFSFISSLFMPAPAMAAVGLPVGGPLVYTFPCTCDDNVWMIFVGPTENQLTSDKFLDYEIGSQLFGSYNIPRTTYLKGFYEPTGPVCYVYIYPSCYSVTSQGFITPVVASAPK
jgi:hypothetical protein